MDEARSAHDSQLIAEMENHPPQAPPLQAAEGVNNTWPNNPDLKTEEEAIDNAIRNPTCAPRRFAQVDLEPIKPIQTDNELNAAMAELHGMAIQYSYKWQDVANAIVEQHLLLRIPMERSEATRAAKEELEVLEHQMRMDNLREAIDTYMLLGLSGGNMGSQ